MQQRKISGDMSTTIGYGANPSKFTARINKSAFRQLSFTVILVLSALLVLFAMQAVVAQELTVKAEGIATEVSKDSVIIDRGGYIISRSTKILNMDGNRIKAEDMRLPVKVRFEYINTNKGPVILWMRAVGV